MKKSYNVLRYVKAGLHWLLGQRAGKSGGKIVLGSGNETQRVSNNKGVEVTKQQLDNILTRFHQGLL